MGALGSIPGLGRSPGEGNSYPLQYSGLENSMDCIVHGVSKSQTHLPSSWVRKICWRRNRLPTPVFLAFPCGSAGKESACNEGDLISIPGLGRFPGKGNGNPLQYSRLKNSMDEETSGLSP